jgi:hypothetical protein
MPCSSYPPWIFIILILLILREEYKLWSSWVCSFLQPPVTLSLLGHNILLSTLFSNALSQCSSLNVIDHVSHQFIVLYISILMLLDSRREETETTISLFASRRYVVTDIQLTYITFQSFSNRIFSDDQNRIRRISPCKEETFHPWVITSVLFKNSSIHQTLNESRVNPLSTVSTCWNLTEKEFLKKSF